MAPGGTVILAFTLNNPDRDNPAASSISFTDNLGDAGGTLSGLAAVPPLLTGTCNGALDGLSGNSLLDRLRQRIGVKEMENGRFLCENVVVQRTTPHHVILNKVKDLS